MSPQEFRQWYLSRLSELVVNQKTIIHSLAFIASDNVQRLSHVVAECIETHIRTVSSLLSSGPFPLLFVVVFLLPSIRVTRQEKNCSG